MCLANSLNPIDKYIRLLKTHDWFYDYSDDHSVWQRGERERAELRQMYKAFDPDVSKDLWNKHAPEMFRMK